MFILTRIMAVSILATLIAYPISFAGTINVDINDSNCLPNSNQSNPYSIVYCNIQDAITDAISSDIVMVADGTYTGEGNKNLDFKGKEITVQSENGPGSTIIDCENNGRGFYFHSGEGKNSVVSGFTIANGRMYRGGGFSIENSSPTISNCIISGNVADDANSGGIGCFDSSPSIIDCLITGNSAGMWGGGIGCFDSSPIIQNCIIADNESKYWWGGGLVSYNSTPNIINCIFSGNYASRYGGGVYLNNSPAIITNCTFSENIADEGGGIFSSYSSRPIITNTILWADSPEEISVLNADALVSYSIIKGGWVGERNFDLYPAFVDSTNGNYRLKNYSPCIGAGTPEGAPDTDIDGNLRPKPVGSNPDIGAYEHSLGERTIPSLDIFALEVGDRWYLVTGGIMREQQKKTYT